MFYIKKRFKGKYSSPWFISILVPTVVVFAALTIVLVLIWLSALELNLSRREEVVTRRVDRASANVKAVLTTYEDMLRMAGGLYDNDTKMMATQQKWGAYIDTINLQERHVGVSSIGFAHAIDDKAAHVQQIQTMNEFPNYTVLPAGSRDSYANIDRIAPYDPDIGNPLVGFDLYSDEKVKDTLEFARDSAELAIIYLPQTGIKTEFSQPSQDLLLAFPVYQSNSEPSTIAERQKTLVGYNFATFYSQDFFSNILINEDIYSYDIGFKAPYGNANIYTTAGEHTYTDTSIKATSSIDYAGKAVTVAATNIQEVLDSQGLDRPKNILLSGSVFVLTVTGFIYMLGLMRANNIKKRESININHAKDELLALASHQLRTPATGVKQYLGMLREGYTGKLSSSQLDLVERAYDGNERQLNIVNELLFVARIDSGRVSLQYKDIDLNQLTREITSDLKTNREKNAQKIKLSLAEDKLIIAADEAYLRMSIENIIDNACKYTDDDGKVWVRVSSKDQDTVQVSVQDNGVGVAEKDIPMLFQKFTRIPSKRTHIVSGSGIGLYLSNKIIEAHGGDITFTSKEGAGTVVLITLPRKQICDNEKTLNI